MKLSLSVRIAEAPESKEETIRSFDEIAELANRVGYHAVCMRASQAGIQTPLEQITAIRKKVGELNLGVSMVTGDFPVPMNNEQGPDGLRNITPYLDVTELLGANLIRICMKRMRTSHGRNVPQMRHVSGISGWRISLIQGVCLRRSAVRLMCSSELADRTSASSMSLRTSTFVVRITGLKRSSSFRRTCSMCIFKIIFNLLTVIPA